MGANLRNDYPSLRPSIVEKKFCAKNNIPVYSGCPLVSIDLRNAGKDMKKIEAIIKPFKLEDVKEALSALGVEGIRAFGKPSSVIYDVKYVLPREAVDGRL